MRGIIRAGLFSIAIAVIAIAVIAIAVIAVAVIAVAIAGSRAAQASEAENVSALLDRYFTAASSRDISKVEPFWAHDPEVILVFPSDKQPAVGWDAVKQSYQAVFDRVLEWKLTPKETPHIQVRQGTAVATTRVLIQGTGKTGSPVSYSLFFSQVFVQHDGQWLIVASHGSRVPD
jgi:ketosteroid isomerase-like protein